MKAEQVQDRRAQSLADAAAAGPAKAPDSEARLAPSRQEAVAPSAEGHLAATLSQDLIATRGPKEAARTVTAGQPINLLALAPGEVARTQPLKPLPELPPTESIPTVGFDWGERNETINVLTIVGNLTWGLVNTLLGTVVALPFLLTGSLPRVSNNGKQLQLMPAFMEAKQGLSLGIWSFGKVDPLHEGGHAIQSAILGPFYLLAIGIPSVMSALLAPLRPPGRHEKSWFEVWASQLGYHNQ